MQNEFESCGQNNREMKFKNEIDNLNSGIRDIMLRCQKMQHGNFEDEKQVFARTISEPNDDVKDQ